MKPDNKFYPMLLGVLISTFLLVMLNKKEFAEYHIIYFLLLCFMAPSTVALIINELILHKKRKNR
ncbi:hypothetical protein MXL46_11185 [Heyndrickxia sporothermodurans]|uniref:hypothetical protein n=1 Tax=Heyndrickxia sporothermodurans TaxID=46224 RepID=UPI002DB814DB|nr:hypothetical protein [Heyndrickxia sporothermodurans]MEB6549649.1 hypothetical protein [Heyndrickxia sporothermodurans]